MTGLPVTIEEIPLGSPRLRIFADLPWRLYRGDPHWTPPLRADLFGNRLLNAVGLLTPQHPYHEHAEVTHFMAWRGREPVGRISAAVNRRFNAHYNATIGFFGFFEAVEDQEVADHLLDAARAWIRARGMTVMRGPGEYSNATHERQGVLVDGFQYPPTVDLTHNPPFYGQLLERYGLRKVKDYHAYTFPVQPPSPPRLQQLAERVRRRREIETRTLAMKDLVEGIRLVVHIYNEAWASNWGFLPITDAEADAVAEMLRPIIDPGLVRFAFFDGEPAAVLGAFPDPYYALRPRWRWYGDSDAVRVARLLWMRQRHNLPRIRLMFYGVRPPYRRLGVDALLFAEAKEYATRQGYQECETSMLLEDNDLIIRASEFMGGHRYKTWRIYEMPL